MSIGVMVFKSSATPGTTCRRGCGGVVPAPPWPGPRTTARGFVRRSTRTGAETDDAPGTRWPKHDRSRPCAGPSGPNGLFGEHKTAGGAQAKHGSDLAVVPQAPSVLGTTARLAFAHTDPQFPPAFWCFPNLGMLVRSVSCRLFRSPESQVRPVYLWDVETCCGNALPQRAPAEALSCRAR